MKNLDSIKLYLFDLDGTVYLGNQLIDGALQTINALREHGKNVVFLTNNSSRSAKSYIEKLNKLGLNVSKDNLLTSTMSTINYIERYHAEKTFYVVGNSDFVSEVKETNIKIDDGDKMDADGVLIAFDTELTYDKLYKACAMIKRGAYFIATHPDDVCPFGETDMPDVGSFLALIEVATKRRPDIICGKPFMPLADFVKSIFPYEKNEIMMIGDRLYTDIAFGIDNGFVSCLVLSGETNSEMLKESSLKPDLILNSIKELI